MKDPFIFASWLNKLLTYDLINLITCLNLNNANNWLKKKQKLILKTFYVKIVLKSSTSNYILIQISNIIKSVMYVYPKIMGYRRFYRLRKIC